MKWSPTMEAKSEKNIGLSSNRKSRTSTNRLIATMIRYSLKKRKLNSSDNKQSAGLSINKNANFNGDGHSQKKKICRSLSKEELNVIQIQLAVLSDGDGDRPIHIAVANENIKLVQKLCYLMHKNSITLDITNYLRQTPLHLAVMVGSTEMIEMLLKFGASPLVCDRNGNSVLHLAVKSHEKKDVLQLLLSHNQVKNILNTMDYEGYSALHYAVFKNNINAVTMLHTFGADMNKIDGKSGRTALIHAVLEQNTIMVDLLLQSGACPQKMDYSGRSAFDMALQIANRQIIKHLEKRIPQNELIAVKEQIKPNFQTSDLKKRTKH